jgi:hypothetical protein
MEITDFHQYYLRYEIGDSFYPAWKPGFEQTEHEVLLFEIETDAAISGVTTASGFAGRMDYLELAELSLVGETHEGSSRSSRSRTTQSVGPAAVALRGRALGHRRERRRETDLRTPRRERRPHPRVRVDRRTEGR